MEDAVAIRAVGLSKDYRISVALGDQPLGDGLPVAPYSTLREAIVDGLSRRARRLPRRREARNFSALRDVDLTVRTGTVVGLIGPNGAGKSTLLKILARVTAPSSGVAELRGRVGTLLEVGTGFHLELTGRENIYLSGAIMGLRRREIAHHFNEIVAFADIGPFLETPLKRYSSGMYLRLAFAVAAHLETEIMLVDEVLAVGDVMFRQRCLGKMREVGRGGRTVVYVSHDMSSVRQLCERAVWLDKGMIVADGPAAEVTARYEASAYARVSSSGGVFVRPEGDTEGKALWFAGVELLDRDGARTTSFSWGDEMRIRIELGGTAPRDGYTIEWTILNELGERAAFGAANPQQDVYFDRRDRVIECLIQALPFTVGNYRLSLRAWIANAANVWDEWSEAGAFRIDRADPFGFGFNATAVSHGVVVVPHTWRSTGREPEGT